jgi:hypothetical protein
MIIFSWCGNTITSAWSNVTARTNTMVVIFRANNSINATTGNAQAGFRATVFFGMLSCVRRLESVILLLQMQNPHLLEIKQP